MNRRTAALLPVTAAAGAAIAVGAGFAAGAGSSHAVSGTRAPIQQEALVKPFTAYGDRNVYDLVPGGNFATKSTGWSLSGDASVIDNGVDSAATGSRALALEGSSSATSTAFRGGDVHTIRFYADNLGSSGSALHVSATVDQNGTMTEIPLGTVTGTGMAPTQIMALPAALQERVTASDSLVRLNISASGSDSHWLVKNVFADPITRCNENC